MDDKLVGFAEELADVARREILPFWRKPIEVQSKVETGRPVAESPVTIADRNAETAMRKLIEARYPDHGIVGEELGTVRGDAEWCWVLVEKEGQGPAGPGPSSSAARGHGRGRGRGGARACVRCGRGRPH